MAAEGDAVELGNVAVFVTAFTEAFSQSLEKALAEAKVFDNQVAGGMRHVKMAQDEAAGSAKTLTEWYGKLKAAALGYLGVLGIRSLVEMADTWSDLTARLRVNTGSTEAASAVMDRLESVARRTYTSLQQTAESFLYNSRALKELGYSTAKQLDFSEALNNALVVSGAKGERAAAVQAAISKAMGLGRLQGQELNTVLSMGGRVAEVIAEKMHTSTNALKGLGQQGKITADVIGSALIGKLETLREQADSMPATMQDAATQMGTALLGFVGRVDEAFNATGFLAARIVDFSGTIHDSVVPTINLLKAAVAGLGSAFSQLGVSSETIGKLAGTFFLSVLGGAAVAAVRLLARTIINVLIAGIFALGAAIRANPIMAIAQVLITAVSAAIMFRDKIKQVIGVDVMGVLKTFGNTVIGVFIFGVQTIGRIIGQLPAMVAAAVTGAANLVIAGINNMVQLAVAGVNKLVDATNTVTFGKFNLSHMVVEPIKELTTEAFPQLQKAWADTGESFAQISKTDYIGALVGIATATDDAKNSTVDLDKATQAAAATADGKAAKAYDKLILKSREFIDQQNLERELIGVGTQDAQRMRYELDLLAQAKNDNIKLGPAQRAELMGLAASMAAAEENTNRLKDAFEFTKETFRGFVQDLRSGLQQGQSIWEAFGNAVLNVLNKIVDKLLNDVVDALFSVSSAGGGNPITSILGSLFGLGGGSGIATGAGLAAGAGAAGLVLRRGAAFNRGNVIPFARGGVVNRPTLFPMARGMGLMGEAGEEGVFPLKRGPDGKLGVAVSGGGMSISFNIDARGAQQGAGSEIARTMEAFVKSPTFKAEVVNTVKDAQSRRAL